MTLTVPKEHGGHEFSLGEYAMVGAEIGKYCGATALTLNMHSCSMLWSGPLADDLLFGDLAEGTTFMAGFHKDSSPAATDFNERFIAENEKRGIRKLGAHHTDAQSYDAIHLFATVFEEQGITGDPAKLEELS